MEHVLREVMLEIKKKKKSVPKRILYSNLNILSPSAPASPFSCEHPLLLAFTKFLNHSLVICL